LPPRIVLVARREKDLQDGQPDYSIWAGEQRVGRIYRKHRSGDRELWFWGINSVICDLTVGASTQGLDATSFEDARARFRKAFDRWLAWALAIPRGDMKYEPVSAQLKKMDAF
jgi:hypothetical protein